MYAFLFISFYFIHSFISCRTSEDHRQVTYYWEYTVLQFCSNASELGSSTYVCIQLPYRKHRKILTENEFYSARKYLYSWNMSMQCRLCTSDTFAVGMVINSHFFITLQTQSYPVCFIITIAWWIWCRFSNIIGALEDCFITISAPGTHLNINVSGVSKMMHILEGWWLW